MARWRLGLEEMAMNDQISSFIRADSTSYPLSLPVLACLCVAFYLIFVASSTTKLYQPIGYRLLPQPLTLPVFGNLFSLTISNPVISMLRLSERFHDCFRLDLPGVSLVVVNSWRYVSEVCNEKVFRKEPVGPLLEARYGAGDGLFTAFTEETNWGVAHRILMPYLSQSAVKKMLHEMKDKTCQLVEKWKRRGGNVAFDPMYDFTQLSLDMIALCALDLRLESLQCDKIHPFAPAMTFFLDESGKRSMRPRVLNWTLFYRSTKKYLKSRDQLHQTAKEAIDKRRRHPTEKDDIMNAMLYSKNPKSGLSLPSETIMYNTLTLLGAGFETTAGMLGFLVYLLLRHPHCMQIAKQEVAEVLQDQEIEQEHLEKLPYLVACIRETLRLYPNAPGFQVKLQQHGTPTAMPAYGLGEEQYLIKSNDVVTINLLALHRDRAIYGNDAEDFKPERMLEREFRALPRHSWKPFGNGVRSCIGQWFAQQEALVVIATLLQRFDLSLAHTDLQIRLQEALTLQPSGLRIFAV